MDSLLRVAIVQDEIAPNLAAGLARTLARTREAADAAGVRLGALVCWEHWMPLARQALHESGKDVHRSGRRTSRPG